MHEPRCAEAGCPPIPGGYDHVPECYFWSPTTTSDRNPMSTWEENNRPRVQSIFEDKPRIFCREIGCPRIPDSPHFDHQPGCFWYGVFLVEVSIPDDTGRR